MVLTINWDSIYDFNDEIKCFNIYKNYLNNKTVQKNLYSKSIKKTKIKIVYKFIFLIYNRNILIKLEKLFELYRNISICYLKYLYIKGKLNLIIL